MVNILREVFGEPQESPEGCHRLWQFPKLEGKKLPRCRAAPPFLQHVPTEYYLSLEKVGFRVVDNYVFLLEGGEGAA